jgi:hypothetical protein
MAKLSSRRFATGHCSCPTVIRAYNACQAFLPEPTLTTAKSVRDQDRTKLVHVVSCLDQCTLTGSFLLIQPLLFCTESKRGRTSRQLFAGEIPVQQVVGLWLWNNQIGR